MICQILVEGFVTIDKDVSKFVGGILLLEAGGPMPKFFNGGAVEDGNGFSSGVVVEPQGVKAVFDFMCFSRIIVSAPSAKVSRAYDYHGKSIFTYRQ